MMNFLSFLSCIGKRAKESCDRGSEVGTILYCSMENSYISLQQNYNSKIITILLD